MKIIPHYPKVLTLGSAFTENIFNGKVIIQEKVDGSMFRFGINEDGQLVIGSKSVAIYDNYPAMFKEAVEYVKTLKLDLPKDTYFYCEYLQKEKHNVLKYERIPKNHLVLFDCLTDGGWLDQDGLKMAAEDLGIDVIPTLYEGEANVEKVRQLLETKSYLGGEIVEGIVIKNYKQTILLGGNVYPLFTKYVREQFKERHQTEWKVKSPKGAIQQYVEGFKNEARWQKAYQYLRDKGETEKNPRDIGKLIKRVQDDIVEEEKENIKNELYKMFIKDILRTSTKGIAEWYKDFLIKSLENK
jgi:hypothetical protein